MRNDMRVLAGFAYAGLDNRPLPQGEVRLRDTADTMTFVACEPGGQSRSSGSDDPSGSYADGRA
jgi:hypothetical protein